MFSHPAEIGDIALQTPVAVAGLMPAYEDIPPEFKSEGRAGPHPYVVFHRRWFYGGLPEDTLLVGKNGVDPEAAFRHLTVINRSRDIKHPHKEAAIAYLASLWIEIPESAESPAMG